MNYAAHRKELHPAMVATEEPVIFTKPDSALLKPGRPFFVPDHLGRIDYEAEVVVRICRLGKTISERFAHRYYDAATVGIDFTARDLQREAAVRGLPWTVCKGFDGAAAIGEWRPAVAGQQFRFRLDRNGQTVQQGCTADMTHSIDRLVSYISQFFTLKTGDLIYTGTPAGIGPVQIGDRLEAWLDGDKVLDLRCR